MIRAKLPKNAIKTPKQFSHAGGEPKRRPSKPNSHSIIGSLGVIWLTLRVEDQTTGRPTFGAYLSLDCAISPKSDTILWLSAPKKEIPDEEDCIVGVDSALRWASSLGSVFLSDAA
jgi:hypothetical protein